MKTYMICSQKGGVGKTMTSTSLAVLAAESGQRVLLIDTDPISSVRALLSEPVGEHDGLVCAAKGDDRAIHQALAPGLDGIFAVERDFPDDETPVRAVSDILNHVAQTHYDVVVLDTQPYAGRRTELLMKISDIVLMVVRADPFSFRTLSPFLRKVRPFCERGQGRSAFAGVAMTLPKGQEPSGQWEAAIRSGLPSSFLDHSIPYDEDFTRPIGEGEFPVLAASDTLASRAYVGLAEELGILAPSMSEASFSQ